jgi:endonuclease/exonuclease/phosphatase family metal-dependent hydrolase
MPTVRVMSFNIRGALSSDGCDGWLFRRARVRRLLAAYRPTVLAAQEVLWPVEHELAAALPRHARVRGPRTGRRLVGVRNPLYVDGAIAIEAQGGFWLSRTPTRFSRGPGARHVRAATWIVGRVGNARVIFVNTHLDHESEAARALAIDVLVAELGRLGWPRIPAIVAGDFNANAGDTLHRRLLDGGLVDSWSGGDDAFTFHGFTGRPVPPDRRIDWILASPSLRVAHAAILRDAEPGLFGPRYPSDHFPVLADFVLDEN